MARLAQEGIAPDIDRMVNRKTPQPSNHPRAGQIAASAADLLMANGLTAWSIEGCAQQAGCAKGLVLHHHRTKDQLLATVARDLSTSRWHSWRDALRPGDVSALDALWDRLLQEHARGSGRALLELRLAGIPGTLLGEPDARALAEGLARALDLTPDELPAHPVLEPLLEGYLLALQRNASTDEVREAFFRYWLSYVR